MSHAVAPDTHDSLVLNRNNKNVTNDFTDLLFPPKKKKKSILIFLLICFFIIIDHMTTLENNQSLPNSQLLKSILASFSSLFWF